MSHNPSLPRSPRVSSTNGVAEQASLSTRAPRHALRLPPNIPGEESSSDDEPLGGSFLGVSPAMKQFDPHVDSLPRQSSYPGASSDNTKPHVSSIVGASSNPSSSRQPFSTSALPISSSASLIPPPRLTENNNRDWRQILGSNRASGSRPLLGKGQSSRGSSSGGKDRYSQEHGSDGRYPDTSGHLHPLDDDVASDDEDEVVPFTGPFGMGDGLFKENSHLSPNSTPVAIPLGPPLEPNTGEEMERMSWQTMLASVLGGDVLQAESSRIGEERTGDETFRQEYGRSLWWQLRAKLRGRSEQEEKRRIEERRGRVVDAVLEEVERFVVRKSAGRAGVGRYLSSEDTHETVEKAVSSDTELESETKETIDPAEQSEIEISALDQVTHILQKLCLIESLYPHIAAVRYSKPLFNSDEFQARVDALTSWSTVVYLLQTQFSALQKWTGSDDLDITKPNTTKEKALVGKNRYHPLDGKAKAQAQASLDQAADDSTFLERIMKEDNLERTFDKRVFTELLALVHNAKQTVISHSNLFKELKLPPFQYELLRIIAFPSRLCVEALKVRLDAAGKLSDPNNLVVDDMITNFRLTIRLAVDIKKSYEEIVAPDPEGRWNIPSCIPPEYDSVLLDALRMFFRLLHWKLKGGSRTIYFRETEVLESEWHFLYDSAEAVSGGDVVVAEHFCALTNKLMVRVCNYFDSQLHVPLPANGADEAMVNKPLATLRKSHNDPHGSSRSRRPMTAEEMLVWYGKILDAVRMRYRKLQRFARRLTTRFDNSAEYILDPTCLDDLVSQLISTGHFLVYTGVLEAEGTYVVAEFSLWNRPDAIQELCQRAFSAGRPSVNSARRPPEPPIDELMPEGGPTDTAVEMLEDEYSMGYLLLLSPRKGFNWPSSVLNVEMDHIDFGLEDDRIRLIADGSSARLKMCQDLFQDNLVNDETGESVVELKCIVHSQAHLPRIQRELRKIARSNHRLTESFIESAAHVGRALAGAPGTQDMTENWYQFASEHGRRAISHVDPAAHTRFTRLLMRLAINWCSFICDSCDPTDRKTFRWTVTALRTTSWVTEGNNILHLDPEEFSFLRKSVASLISLLISHFDILGARSTMEAKKEADKMEALRRLQRKQEKVDDYIIPRTLSPSGQVREVPLDRSIRLVQEERLRLIAELEATRVGFSNDQHLIGQVLDEQVFEDRALVFLAASSSNIALRWQQGSFIGGGANGNVYLGFNLDSGGIMAVKEIRVQDLSNSPALYKQIKDESDVMSMLSHPNIVEYFGIEVHRDRVFIFQEYCEGGSLADQLAHGRIEDEDVVILYALQMLQGLEYLHSKGIEHRDVKPENILLGSNSTLKFGDFGAAKVIAKGNRTMAKTRAIRIKAAGAEGLAVMNTLAGTPMYMAPEVIRANEKSGHLGCADIWSMGCVLLEISTGRKPWSNLDNEWAIMFHIGIATQAPPLPEHGELSELGIDFIERCLTLDAKERPTATDLLYHPWLAPMLQQFTEHAQSIEGSSQGGPSATSTLVDPHDVTAYAAQIADIAKQSSSSTPAEELSSFNSTPACSTPDGLDTETPPLKL